MRVNVNPSVVDSYISALEREIEEQESIVRKEPKSSNAEVAASIIPLLRAELAVFVAQVSAWEESVPARLKEIESIAHEAQEIHGPSDAFQRIAEIASEELMP